MPQDAQSRLDQGHRLAQCHAYVGRALALLAAGELENAADDLETASTLLRAALEHLYSPPHEG